METKLTNRPPGDSGVAKQSAHSFLNTLSFRVSGVLRNAIDGSSAASCWSSAADSTSQTRAR